MHGIKNLEKVKVRLLSWYRRHRRDLPWRGVRDPYAIWISELMLQQTQVSTVIAYYRNFMRRFPTVRRLASADPDSVLKAWEGLGYYRRARYAWQAAQMIVRQYKGQFPADYEQLMQLPGFGDYTAGAVLSIAFNQRYPALDGNVLRVMARLTALKSDVRKKSIRIRIADTVMQMMGRSRPSDFNQSLMELGAKICRPQKPLCPQCPIRSHCAGFSKGLTEILPMKAGKKTKRVEPVAVGIIVTQQRCVIGRRSPDRILGNLWEFPGGKILEGESPEEACMREVLEETGLHVQTADLILRKKHHYSHYAVDLHFFLCHLLPQRKIKRLPKPWKWIQVSEFDRYAFPASTRLAIRLLLRRVQDS